MSTQQAVLTPVEMHTGVYLKRDDLYDAGSKGVLSGSKLRQCMYLIQSAYRDGCEGVISSASVLSPQLAISSWCAKECTLPCIQVVGGTTPTSAAKYPSIAIANMLGAQFRIINCGYNTNLQREVARLHTQLPTWYPLEYGISIDHNKATPQQVAAFHLVGAQQVQNIPKNVQTLLIPFGSGNSAASILYGLELYPLKNLHRIVLFGIGPSRLDWLHTRLEVIGDGAQVSVASQFDFPYRQHSSKARYEIVHHSLYDEGFATYQSKMPYTWDAVEMHPTYEGKCWQYMRRHPTLWHQYLDKSKALFWIVGAPLDAQRAVQAWGVEIPTRVRLWQK